MPENKLNNSYETREKPIGSATPPPAGPPPRSLYESENRSKPSGKSTEKK
ncbi:hypothetical protein [Sporosarcina sp. G11-34]|nr:hypothetical protein [Sporosarcina sp. G11-34]MCZ2259857.1 hypothetical protein [Sporosarcina sp. G11-34]